MGDATAADVDVLFSAYASCCCCPFIAGVWGIGGAAIGYCDGGVREFGLGRMAALGGVELCLTFGFECVGVGTCCACAGSDCEYGAEVYGFWWCCTERAEYSQRKRSDDIGRDRNVTLTMRLLHYLRRGRVAIRPRLRLLESAIVVLTLLTRIRESLLRIVVLCMIGRSARCWGRCGCERARMKRIRVL